MISFVSFCDWGGESSVSWWVISGYMSCPHLIPLSPLVELPDRVMVCPTLMWTCAGKVQLGRGRCLQSVCAFTEANSLKMPGRYRKAHRSELCRMQNFAAEIEDACKVENRQVCLTFWQLEQLLPWLLGMVLSRLSKKAWTCRAPTIGWRPN